MWRVLRNYNILFFACLFLAPVSSALAETESWYTYWAFGISRHKYYPELRTFVDDAKNSSGTFSHSEGSYDVLGFYWPVAERTLLGFVLSGSSETVTKVTTNEPKSFYELFGSFPYFSGAHRYLSISQALYAASTMHFYGKEPGDGFFVRGDAGIARLSIKSEIAAPVGDATGLGVQVGVGYGFAVSEESRLLIGLYGGYNRFGGHDYITTSLRIGGLW